MNKFKNGIHKEFIPLYKIAISYSTNSKVMSDYLGINEVNNVNGFCFHDLDINHLGVFVPIDDDYKIIQTSTFAHECFHAAMACGEMVGLEPTLTANEEIAYILGWIVEWIEGCIDKERKLNFKHN